MLCARRRRHSEKGTILPALAAMIIVLILLTGLVVDVGVLQDQRGQAQNAADAAAVAGAMELLPSGNGSTWASNVALNTTAWNGFTNGAGNTTVSATPNTGSGTMTVVITRNVNTYFMNMLGLHTMPVTVTAVAGLGPSSSCLVALSDTASPGLEVGGNVTLNCGVQVNSNSNGGNYAVNWQGTSGCIQSTAININGGYYESGGACSGGHYAVNTSGGALTPATGKPQISDPLAATLPTAPATSPCTYSSQVTYTNNQTPPGNIVQPGVYCGGLQINGTNGTVTFASGTYVMYNGGFTVNSGSTITSASGGVTFYLTGASGSQVGNINFSGNGVNATLSAPTTGTYSGLLFWVDGKSTSSNANIINGQAGSNFNGTIYMPSTQLEITGQSNLIDTGNYSIVANTINVNGQGNLSLTRGSGSGSSQQLAQLNQ